MNTQEFKVYVQSLGLRIGTFNIVSIPRKGDVFAFTNANTIIFFIIIRIRCNFVSFIIKFIRNIFI